MWNCCRHRDHINLNFHFEPETSSILSGVSIFASGLPNTIHPIASASGHSCKYSGVRSRRSLEATILEENERENHCQDARIKHHDESISRAQFFESPSHLSPPAEVRYSLIVRHSFVYLPYQDHGNRIGKHRGRRSETSSNNNWR
jgi:hypothetical protein